MDVPKDFCPTKATLLTAWQNATEEYSKAVAELSMNTGTVPKSEYERLAEAAEIARHVSRKMKAALDSHIDEHECDGDGDDEAAA
jgi:hypothetical protein